MSQWTIMGYDACVNMCEETVDAEYAGVWLACMMQQQLACMVLRPDHAKEAMQQTTLCSKQPEDTSQSSVQVSSV